jgi:hypothetical integral membrane protein (TIGR02206 family)
MQGAQLAFWLWLGAASLWAVRKGRVSVSLLRRVALMLLACSMMITITLTLLDHKDLLRTLLPLHLCSLSAFMTLYLLATGSAACYHFCWYLGMPGAILALMFPAVEPSSWQHLMNTSFMLTHALVAFAPLLLLAEGRRPDPLAAGNVLLAGNIFLLIVYGADRLLDANYMFLLWAPAGTPLQTMARLGRVGYFACIELGAILTVLGMRALAKKVGWGRVVALN